MALGNLLVTMSLNNIVATNTTDIIAVFYGTITFVITLVALLTSSAMM
jgi:hypothetical protein